MQEVASRKPTTARLLSLIAGMTALLAPLAAIEAAESDVALDNLTFTLGATTYRIPRLELKGVSLPAAELADLLKGDEKSVDGRLARLSAKSLRIPSMTAERKAGDAVERALYRELTAEGVVAGRIAVAHAAGTEQTIEKPGGDSVRYLWGATVSKGIDLRQLIHMTLAARLDPQEALKPIVDEENVESLTLEDKGERITIKTGRIAVTGVKGRAFAAPLPQLLDRLERFDPDKSEADPALLKDLVDAISSLEVGSLEVRDIVATGKGEPADKPYSAQIGRIAASRIAGAAVGDLALENLALQSSDGGTLSLKRFGLRDARLSSLIDNPFPLVGHIEAKGLEGDLPDASVAETSRMKFSLAGAEADFTDFREIAPTKLSARLDRLAIDLAARGETSSTAQFLALGYRDLDLSAALAGEWREKEREAVFAPLRVEGKDMGVATLNVVFGNVSSAVFSPIALVSKAAALASSLKAVELTLEGGALVDRLVALEAKEEKKPLEKARVEYARTAAAVVAALFGEGEKARKIADAVSAFIMKPKRLHVRLASEKGVNALDALAKKPGDILEGVEVEAVSER